MTRIAPWYVAEPAGLVVGASKVGGPDVGGGVPVYHDREECPITQAVPVKQRTQGTGGYELCPVCRPLPG